MVCGTVPFKAHNMADLHKIIVNGSFKFPSAVDDLLSPEVKDLVRKMLVLKPEDRISIPEILAHQWITTDFEERDLDG